MAYSKPSKSNLAAFLLVKNLVNYYHTCKNASTKRIFEYNLKSMKKVTIENAKKVGQGLGIPKKHLGEFETIIQEALQKPNESVTWDNLRELLLDREKRGTMTRYALAKKAGLPESTIHRVLDGTQEPKINTLIKISKAVGINIQAS